METLELPIWGWATTSLQNSSFRIFSTWGDTQCWRSCCVHTNDLRTALPRLRSTCWWSILPHSPTWQIRVFQSYYSPEAISPLRHCPPEVNSRTRSTQGIDAFGTQQNRFAMVSIFSWSCWWCCCKVHEPCVCGHFYLASYQLYTIRLDRGRSLAWSTILWNVSSRRTNRRLVVPPYDWC